jgi:hypothetical protein
LATHADYTAQLDVGSINASESISACEYGSKYSATRSNKAGFQLALRKGYAWLE